MKIKAGDHLTLEQDNGHKITIYVGENEVVVKAENPGTSLDVIRENHFAVTARAIAKP